MTCKHALCVSITPELLLYHPHRGTEHQFCHPNTTADVIIQYKRPISFSNIFCIFWWRSRQSASKVRKVELQHNECSCCLRVVEVAGWGCHGVSFNHWHVGGGEERRVMKGRLVLTLTRMLNQSGNKPFTRWRESSHKLDLWTPPSTTKVAQQSG